MRWITYILCCFFYLGLNAQEAGDIPILNETWLKESLEITPATNINTKRSEFSPAYYGKGIVYVGNYRTNKNDFFQLWYADLESNLPQNVRALDLRADTMLHEGPVCFDESQRFMFFTRSNIVAGDAVMDEEWRVQLKVYQASRDLYGTWNNIIELPFNGDRFSTCHPTWDESHQRIIFASDRLGSEGKMDLFMSDRVDGKWTEAVNLGPQLNTPDNEIFPFYHPAGYLFFVSDRGDGYGGYDLFYSEWRNGQFTTPTLLPEPINSKFDDFGFIMNNTATAGFISSNRKGGRGEDDIYSFISGESLLGNKVKEIVSSITIKVLDSTSLTGLEGVDLYVFPLPEDVREESELFEVAVEPVTRNEEGFRLRYKLKEKINQDQIHSITDQFGRSSVTGKARRRYLIQAEKDGFYSIQHVVDIRERDNLDGLVLYMLPAEEQIARLQINLSESLSADNVLATIRNANTNDTYTQRLDEDGTLEFPANSDDIYVVTIASDGFQTKTIVGRVAEFSGSRIDLIAYPGFTTAAGETLKTDTLSATPIIVLEHIYYDLDDYTIKPEYTYELKLLADLLRQYPDVRIELTSHTDSRGTTEYNQRLSNQRAETAKQFLVNEGISSSRIVAIGMGEGQLRNHCKDGVNCTEEQHTYNRRTEVRVIE